ncbi:MAG TPA: YhjD/YihY/BrkB family envelope integrity protein [Alphaproteobacteria bacterium]
MIARLKEWFERIIWEQSGATGWRRPLLVAVQIAYALVRDLTEGQLSLRAMSLVYTTLLSIVPLLAITFSVLKGFGVHNQIEPLLMGMLAPLGDQGNEIAARIIEFVDKMQVGVLGSVGLVMLIYTVVSLIQKVEMAFNAIWNVGRNRSLAARFSGYISILVLGPILVFSSLGVSATVSSSSAMMAISSLPVLSFVLHQAGLLIPYVIIIAAFTLLYKFLPNTRVKFLSALIGGVVAGVLWESVGWAFAAYVVKSSNYSAIYSAFATLILFMIWLYVAWLILLVGASVSFYHQHPECVVAKRRDLQLSLRGQEHLVLAVAAWIAKCFQDGAPPPDVEQLVQRYQVPAVTVEATLAMLERAGFIRCIEGKRAGYVPARPPEATEAATILDAARGAGPGRMRLTATLEGQPAVLRVAKAVEAAVDRALKGVTLRDLAEGTALATEEAGEKVAGQGAAERTVPAKMPRTAV